MQQTVLLRNKMVGNFVVMEPIFPASKAYKMKWKLAEVGKIEKMDSSTFLATKGYKMKVEAKVCKTYGPNSLS